MISIILSLIIVLETVFILFLGSLVIAAIASAWQKAWAECCSRRPVAPTLADYRRAFAVEPAFDWLTA